MKIITQKHHYSLFVLLIGLISLGGCSSTYYDRNQARSLPELPEVSRPARLRPVYKAPKKAVIKRPSSAKVRKYSVSKPKVADSVTTSKKEVSSVIQDSQTLENNDPYASIPENNSSVVLNNKVTKPVARASQSSPAVKSLLIQAQADLAIGRASAAAGKLERGLRIESQNAKLWSLLAKAHYDQADYQQAITMSKKSIRYSSDDELIARNWALIKKSGLNSGDTTVVKEANDYIKLNP